jgi:hypothetical protein
MHLMNVLRATKDSAKGTESLGRVFILGILRSKFSSLACTPQPSVITLNLRDIMQGPLETEEYPITSSEHKITEAHPVLNLQNKCISAITNRWTCISNIVCTLSCRLMAKEMLWIHINVALIGDEVRLQVAFDRPNAFWCRCSPLLNQHGFNASKSQTLNPFSPC